MRRESPINVDRRHEEEFPLWFRNRDDVMPAGGKRLWCDSSIRAESSPRRSAINKENRAKLKIVHTSERGLSTRRALLKNPESDEISPALLYKKTHTNKDGMWTSEDARKILKKWKRYSCSTSQRESHTPKWRFFAEVLGTKAGYVRGLGHSVRSVGSSSSASFVDLSRGWRRPDYRLRR
ncbi:hypothetical protein CJ030_MR5G009723 [Morella rubra]|uniref:Uncharacterized protein n=1 Tax=Morella rubra TaxID=262757 RepID=A0A6A1VIP0_9ROSI|nr:hypothetical protein CJ030_MR5G009723 [Morella rubra]